MTSGEANETEGAIGRHSINRFLSEGRALHWVCMTHALYIQLLVFALLASVYLLAVSSGLLQVSRTDKFALLVITYELHQYS